MVEILEFDDEYELFDIDHETGELSFIDAPDFEYPMGGGFAADGDAFGEPEGTNTYEVTVVAVDSDELPDFQTIVVDVTDVNENPVIISGGGENSLDLQVGEGHTKSVTIVDAIDPEDDATRTPLTYLVGGPDADDFNIDAGGVLTFNGPPSFDNPTDENGDNVYEVTVFVLDSGSLADGQQISVTVTDAPVITSNGGGESALINVDENSTTVTTVTATDVEDDADAEASVTYSLAGGIDEDAFLIDETSGVLTFNAAPDFENPMDAGESDNVYEVTVQVTDSDGLVDQQDISVNVLPVNDDPVLLEGEAEIQFVVDEGTHEVGVITATDTEDDHDGLAETNVAFSISGGVDQAAFSIDAETGELTFDEAPDFENPTDNIGGDNDYEIEVTATDSGGATDTATVIVEVDNINEDPTITSSGTFEVPEGDETAVTTVTAADDEDDQLEETSLTFSIVESPDAEAFDIDPATGELTFSAPPIHVVEGDNSYEVHVAVTDTDGQSDVQVITVQVTDAPEFTSDVSFDVIENETVVGTVTATDVEDDGDEAAETVVTFAIVGGDDQDLFEIDEHSGVLTFKDAPDFESPADFDEDNDYEVVVRATDSDGQLTEQAITVTVSEVNEAPVIGSDGGQATANVNATEGSTTVTTVEATDDEDDLSETQLSYQIVGGDDQDLFAINQLTGELTFDEAQSYESPNDADEDSKYEVNVAVFDSENEFDTQAITVSVTDGPVITSDGGGQAAAISVDENQTAATDVDASDTEDDVAGTPLVYAITGGADMDLFLLDANGVLTFAEAPNFESPSDDNGDGVFEVEVTVTDSDELAVTQTLSITVDDVNDQPLITSDGGGEGGLDVLENTTDVTMVTATDEEDGTSLTYQLVGGTDEELFDIDPVTGQLSFIEAPDHEQPTDQGEDNTYEVEVGVMDSDAAVETQTIMVNVTNESEVPEITSDGGESTASVAAEENQQFVTVVEAIDDENDAAEIPFDLAISGGADMDEFGIDSDGDLFFVNPPDFENPSDADEDGTYEVEVTVTDADENTDSQTISVTVANVNEAPTIDSDEGGETASVDAVENQVSVTTVTASDAEDGANLEFSITGGADEAAFSIDSATGVLELTEAPNFEDPASADEDNSYEVEVTATDAGGLTDVQTITVNVTNEPELPDVNSHEGAEIVDVSVDENTSAVTTVTASDEEDESLEYSISGIDAGAFTIDSETGELSFSEAPDFENPSDSGADNVYQVEVTATDSDDMTDAQTVNVTVNDVNEAPAITSETTNVEVAENETSVATVTAEDAEDTSLVYSLSGGADMDLFTIDAATGEISFVDAPDFEQPGDVGGDNSYELEVTVTDSGELVDSQMITVEVSDVAESPEITSDDGGDTANIEISENQTDVRTITADDEDAETTLTFSISGGDDQDAFSIDPDTGALTMNVAPDFENPADENGDNAYEVEVTVTDENELTDSQTISVSVADVEEHPEITSDGGEDTASVEAAENQTVATSLSGTDDEDDVSETSLAWSISGGADSELFTISSETGELLFNEAPDFEAPGDTDGDNVYEVSVTATDSDGFTDSQDISVNVTDQIDPVIDLEVVTSADRTEIGADGLIIWTVTVTNNADTANTDATGVQITNVSPVEASLQVAIPSNGTYEDGLWTLDNPLSPGQSASLTLVSTVTSDSLLGAEIENLAYVSSANELDVDSVPSDDSLVEDDADNASATVAFGSDPNSGGSSSGVTVDGNVVTVVASDGDDNVELILGEETHVLNVGEETFTYDATVVNTFDVTAGLGTDEIRVIGTSLDDTANAIGDEGDISSTAYTVYTHSFDTIIFDGVSGNDYAQIYGSNGEDDLQGLPQDSTLTTPDNVFQMLNFGRVDAYGRGGGDYASVYGTQGVDDFYTFNTFEVLQGEGHYQKTLGFSRVDAFGRGGEDLAHLFDTIGNDHLYSFATHVVMQSDHLLAYIKGFEDIETAANKGGDDTANLFNLMSVDTFFGEGNVASVTGPNRTIEARDFDTVNVEANAGETPTSSVSEIDYVLSSQGDWLI